MSDFVLVKKYCRPPWLCKQWISTSTVVLKRPSTGHAPIRISLSKNWRVNRRTPFDDHQRWRLKRAEIRSTFVLDSRQAESLLMFDWGYKYSISSIALKDTQHHNYFLSRSFPAHLQSCSITFIFSLLQLVLSLLLFWPTILYTLRSLSHYELLINRYLHDCHLFG